MSGGLIHANETSYVVKPSTGVNFTRINTHGGSGTVRAPYLWESEVLTINLVSENAADMTMEMVGNEPHLMIYDNQCVTVGPTTDPWFDIVVRECMGGGNL